MKNFIVFLLLSVCMPLWANPEPHLLQEPLDGQIVNFEILPDSGYTFEQVRRLAFLPKQTMNIHQNYWLRFTVQNPYYYPRQCYIWVFPPINNTLYYYHREKQAWVSETAGAMHQKPEHIQRLMHCYFNGNGTDTLYIKVETSLLRRHAKTDQLNPKIEIINTQTVAEQKAERWNIWLTTVCVMICFFLYNAYLYFFFKERSYFYYLVIVGSGLCYLTGILLYWDEFIAWPFLHVALNTKNHINWYVLNSMGIELGGLGVVWGFIGFTRSYLQTHALFPMYDKCMRIGGIVLTALIFVSVSVTSSGLIYMNQYTVTPTNVVFAIVVLMLLGAGVITLRKAPELARYFLIANALPLLLIILLAVYMAIFKFNNAISIWAPSIALISQALAFAVALVARVNLLKEELGRLREQAQGLQHENEQMVSRNQFIEMENEYIMAEIALEKNQKEELQAKLEANQRELASNAMYMFQKNEMLADLQKQIERLSQQSNTQHKEVIKEIKATLQNNLQLDADWERFRTHFEQVHPTFFEDLQARCPDLTPYEQRLAAYLHINLSNKEISVLLNIAPESVRKAKMRLNKKLNPESPE